MATAAAPHNPDEKKKLVRRLRPDRSQRIRHFVQGAFVALNAWLSIQFYLWVRYYERGGTGLYVSRPAGAEGWLPIAGLMNLKYFLATGRVPRSASRSHVSADRLPRDLFPASEKAFCSWLCPVGTISEYLWRHRPQTLPP